MKFFKPAKLLCLSLVLFCAGQFSTAQDASGPGIQKYVNGQWFDGNSFAARTVWVMDGMLKFDGNDLVHDTIIDLSGNYVIPPFAEAHNHNLESDYELQKRINKYLNNGVFYVKHLSSIKKRIDPLMHHYNKPDGIDVSLAHAPLTGTGGHPIALRKRFLEYGYFDDMFKTIEDIEGHGYWIIDDLDELNSKWDRILAAKPDFIKLNLLHSEEYESRKTDTAYFGNKGLNPALVPDIVKRAHEQNLRVSAHVNTAHDFHVAVTAGVDEIAHLPEIRNGKQISKEDATLAARNGTVIVTTATLVLKNKKQPNYNDLIANIRSNLSILRDAGAIIAIGSDGYNDNSVGEFKFLHDLDLFTASELLRMWCMHAAQTTFPNRKIGHLKDGYEASFLVLNRNPLEGMAGITNTIELRVKQGLVLGE